MIPCRWFLLLLAGAGACTGSIGAGSSYESVGDGVIPGTGGTGAVGGIGGSGTGGSACSGAIAAGRPVLRRLNRDEYTNSLRELLGITSRPGDILPDEGSSPEGFNTNGDYLAISTPLISKLVEASGAAISEGLLASRAGLLACSAGTTSPATGPCPREIVTRFGKRAFRRPLTAVEIDAHAKIVTDAKSSGLDDDTSIKLGLQTILMSPFFLFQLVNEPRPDDPQAAYRLDDYELAARLAYFLRASIPDQVLVDLADRKQLGNPDVLRAQVKRLLADAGSARFAESWSGQWLKTRDVLTTVNPPASVIANFDDALRQSMKRETDAFFENLIRADLNLLEALTADYSFLDARMAKHYGINDVIGTSAKRVTVTGANRKGVLTHASIMAATTHSGHTSPIARGNFVLSQLMCTALTLPPDIDIPSLEELTKKFNNLSVRQIMEEHRQKPACAGCHIEMDPIGLAFEVFDPVGRHRMTYPDNGLAIDSSGELPNAGAFRDHQGLIDLLAKDRRQQVKRCFTTMVMTYAIGRSMQASDRCVIEQIADRLDDTQGISDLVTRVVLSDQFRGQGAAFMGAR